MITPEEYLNHNYNVIPCYENDKRPKGDDWENKPSKLERFGPGDNIGLHLLDHIDIDIDNPVAHKFLARIKQMGCAIYGRKSNPESHFHNKE